MAAITTTNPADFANRQQTFFDKKLMASLKYNLRLGAYGTDKELPANSAGTTIRFFRPRVANLTGVQALTDGVAPATLTEVAVGYVDCT
jgi:hypothetical protein